MNIITIMMTVACVFAETIIIRHDRNDSEYQNLSKQFENRICHLNLGKNVPDGEGTVIHPNWILTAAHCAIDIKSKIDNGEQHLVTITNEHHNVNKVVIHERWSENEAYDIALIHIDKASKTAEPVDIYRGTDELNKLVYSRTR